MTETMLLRLAMVLQNQAPSTLNKYICKLAEAILMEYPDGLSVYALQEALVEHFNLSFTEEEIEEAISKKGQNNDFIVSADQLLISWTGNAFSGVPIVVLPSVWLSIILRFTGRTDDDYKSFCLFLTQRQHISAADTRNQQCHRRGAVLQTRV